MAGTDDIEFLDAAPASLDDEPEVVDGGTSAGRWFGLGCALVVSAWLVVSSGGDPVPPVDEAVERPPAATDEPEATPPPIANRSALVTPPEYGAWPNPPTNRDPAVNRVPGPDERPSEFETLDSTTLVYVSRAGDPTVVSFDTGDVFDVAVAAIRVHERFAVEDGAVVSLVGGNVALADATDQAVVFHTYRDVDGPGVGTMGDELGVGRGPEVCLSDASCRLPGQGVERMLRGGLIVQRFDPERHVAIAELLNGWERDDLSLVSPGGYRLPEPGSVIWVIGPPNTDRPAASGLL